MILTGQCNKSEGAQCTLVVYPASWVANVYGNHTFRNHAGPAAPLRPATHARSPLLSLSVQRKKSEGFVVKVGKKKSKKTRRQLTEPNLLLQSQLQD